MGFNEYIVQQIKCKQPLRFNVTTSSTAASTTTFSAATPVVEANIVRDILIQNTGSFNARIDYGIAADSTPAATSITTLVRSGGDLALNNVTYDKISYISESPTSATTLTITVNAGGLKSG